jgi:hypothetical protein
MREEVQLAPYSYKKVTGELAALNKLRRWRRREKK